MGITSFSDRIFQLSITRYQAFNVLPTGTRGCAKPPDRKGEVPESEQTYDLYVNIVYNIHDFKLFIHR